MGLASSSDSGVAKAGEIQNIIDRVIREGRLNLLEHEAEQICVMSGISVPEFALATNPREAATHAARMGYPIALKVISPDIIHKTESGGVALGLGDQKSVEGSFLAILSNAKRHNSNARIEGVLVQKMAPPAIAETIVGSFRDPQFGPALVFGIGGIFTELINDVTFGVAPLSKARATQMIRSIRAYPAFAGYRGLPLADEPAICEILRKVSVLITEFPQISEIDLNPTLVYEKGAVVVDARMILASPGQVRPISNA